ncbi:MAG: hypothetical protein ACLFPF_10610 [Halanaerobiales bacterium]
MKNKVGLIVFLGLFLVFSNIVFAEDIDMEDPFSEENLFSEDMFISQDDVISDDVGEELNKTGLGISGELQTVVSYNKVDLEKSWLLNLDQTDSDYYTGDLVLDLLFDARFKNRIRALLNLDLYYNYNDYDENSNTDYFVKEVFVDIPYQEKIYIRAGKQTLKWGKSYFWNPTDLVNVERKDISDINKSREGTEGIKIHIPYGAERNLYFFINTNGIDSVDRISQDIALSAKYAFLYGNSEMSFSLWTKKDFQSVYGFDISTGLNDIDIRGEVSLSKGDNNFIMDYDTFEVYQEKDKIVSRASAGFSTFFDHGDISDRISLSGEFYYNSNGYGENIYKKIDEISDPLTRQTVKYTYLGEVYQANRNSKYYAAFFTQYKEFLDPDLTLNFNGLVNLMDFSKTLSLGMNYQPRSNLFFDLNYTKFLGDKNTEAVFLGNDYSLSFATNYRF